MGDNTYNGAFFVEPGVMSIAFSYGNLKDAVIAGSGSQHELSAFNRSLQRERSELDRLNLPIDSIRTLLTQGAIGTEEADRLIKEADKKLVPVRLTLRNRNLSYMMANLDSYVSLMLLKYLIGRVSNDSIDMFYSRFSDKVRNSSMAYNFLQSYTRYKKAVGDDYPFDQIMLNEAAPAFTIYTGPADSITLDAFKGSVVLLEFWGLSCLPCLEGNPLIEKLRRQYANEGIKVIGISNSTIRELSNLSRYIVKNGFSEWIHVSTGIGYQQAGGLIRSGNFDNYYSLGIPKSVLIGRDGKVLYRHFGYSAESMKELEQLIQEATNSKVP